ARGDGSPRIAVTVFGGTVEYQLLRRSRPTQEPGSRLAGAAIRLRYQRNSPAAEHHPRHPGAARAIAVTQPDDFMRLGEGRRNLDHAVPEFSLASGVTPVQRLHVDQR